MTPSHWPDHLERRLLSRIGAARTLEQSYETRKWAEHVGPLLAEQLGLLLEAHVNRYVDTTERLRGARDALVKARQLLVATPGRPLEHTVYLLYSPTALLYVGVTSKGPTRLVQHARQRPWWCQVYRVEFEHYATRREAAAREAQLIRQLLPVHNIVHSEWRRGA